MLKKIKKYIETHICKNLNKKKIIVGLSGGPDSVFLLYFFKDLEKEFDISLAAAHLNHGWRDEAKRDEDFCRKLCKKLDIKFFSEHAKNIKISIKPNGSKEETGRRLRRKFFEDLKEKHKFDYIALAHHQQDQQETFFIRLMRGCSLDGLTAIKPVNLPYIRPLLTTPKHEILQYLEENKISYVIDQSNFSNNFLRNRIRSNIIPELEKADKRFSQKFETTLETLDQENRFIEKATQNKFTNMFARHISGNLLIGCQEKFCELDPILQKRVTIKWLCDQNVKFCPSTGLLEEIIKFLSSKRGGTHKIHENWVINKKQKKFWISDRTRS